LTGIKLVLTDYSIFRELLCNFDVLQSEARMIVIALTDESDLIWLEVMIILGVVAFGRQEYFVAWIVVFALFTCNIE